MPASYMVELTEGERQMNLLALANLAVERPGWENALRELAAKFDDDHLTLFNHFRQLALHNAPGLRRIST